MPRDRPQDDRGEPDDPNEPDDLGRESKWAHVGDRSAAELERAQLFGSRVTAWTEASDVRSETDGRRGVERATALRDIFTDDDGNLIGDEDNPRVRLLPRAELTDRRQEIHQRLGPPDQVVDRDKGVVEIWQVTTNPPSRVTFRTFSKSGGPAIDFHWVPEFDDVKRFHMKREPRERH